MENTRTTCPRTMHLQTHWGVQFSGTYFPECATCKPTVHRPRSCWRAGAHGYPLWKIRKIEILTHIPTYAHIIIIHRGRWQRLFSSSPGTSGTTPAFQPVVVVVVCVCRSKKALKITVPDARLTKCSDQTFLSHHRTCRVHGTWELSPHRLFLFWHLFLADTKHSLKARSCRKPWWGPFALAAMADTWDGIIPPPGFTWLIWLIENKILNQTRRQQSSE